MKINDQVFQLKHFLKRNILSFVLNVVTLRELSFAMLEKKKKRNERKITLCKLSNGIYKSVVLAEEHINLMTTHQNSNA